MNQQTCLYINGSGAQCLTTPKTGYFCYKHLTTKQGLNRTCIYIVSDIRCTTKPQTGLYCSKHKNNSTNPLTPILNLTSCLHINSKGLQCAIKPQSGEYCGKHRKISCPVTEYKTCLHINSKGSQCTVRPQSGEYCGKHKKKSIHTSPPIPIPSNVTCPHINSNGVYCTVKPQSGAYCGKHKKTPHPAQTGGNPPQLVMLTPDVLRDIISSNFPKPPHSNIRRVYKKVRIPSAVRSKVWNTFIDIAKGQDRCFCCNCEPITKTNFECGHILSERDGGPPTIQNLRPICKNCNSSMGTNNMIEFMTMYNFDKRPDFDQKPMIDFSDIIPIPDLMN